MGGGQWAVGSEQWAVGSVSYRAQCSYGRIVIDDFDDGGKRNLYHLAIGALDFHAGRSQRLRGFHAEHDAAHAMAIARYNLDIGFAVKRSERRQGPGNFHSIS